MSSPPLPRCCVHYGYCFVDLPPLFAFADATPRVTRHDAMLIAASAVTRHAASLPILRLSLMPALLGYCRHFDAAMPLLLFTLTIHTPPLCC